MEEISYPIKFILAGVNNILPSQKPMLFELKRKDADITVIGSGADGKAQITVSADFEAIAVGQFITFKTDGYPLQSAKILSIDGLAQITVDTPFTNTTVTNNFLNYHTNHFIEVRYVLPTSTSDDQSAIELIEDYTRVPAAKDGSVKININAPAENLLPELGSSTSYKIQYRESYEGERSKLWISPLNDYPLLVILGSQDLPFNDFTDKEITKRYYRGYPLYYSYIYSAINDNDENSIKFYLTQYAINKDVIQEDLINELTNVNGVINLQVDTSLLHDDTCFVAFHAIVSSLAGQFEPTDFNPLEFA